MMKVKNIYYSNSECAKIVYYFQNKSLLRIIYECIKLKFTDKITEKEIHAFVRWEKDEI